MPHTQWTLHQLRKNEQQCVSHSPMHMACRQQYLCMGLWPSNAYRVPSEPMPPAPTSWLPPGWPT